MARTLTYASAPAQIEKATCSEGVDANGLKGESWLIPLSLSVQRVGVDKKGAPCWVYDYVVHPETVAKAQEVPRFLDVVLDSAFERIEAATSAKLQRNYRRLAAKFKATPGVEQPGVQVRAAARPPALTPHAGSDCLDARRRSAARAARRQTAACSPTPG